MDWTTATETQTAGFNVYRADGPEGPYQKVNSQLIPGALDPLRGGRYQFRDESADATRTYYYKLEELEMDGRTSLFGPVVVQPSFPVTGAIGTGLGVLAVLLLVGGGVWYVKTRQAVAVS